jgi:branched-chain amino acid aminotransferase
MGYEVQERIVSVEETLEWVSDGEAALSGTAAVLAGVGTLIWQGREIRVADGGVGPVTKKLRAALVDVQRGVTADRFGWLTPV